MRHKGNRHQPGSAHGPRGSQGPLGITPGHPRRWLRFGTFFADMVTKTFLTSFGIAICVHFGDIWEALGTLLGRWGAFGEVRMTSEHGTKKKNHSQATGRSCLLNPPPPRRSGGTRFGTLLEERPEEGRLLMADSREGTFARAERQSLELSAQRPTPTNKPIP